MRIVIMTEISYPMFEKIRNLLYKYISYALISNTYCNQTAYFQFWDEAYIPLQLKSYISSPVNKKVIEELDAELKKIWMKEEVKTQWK